jgi:hypothetical protein
MRETMSARELERSAGGGRIGSRTQKLIERENKNDGGWNKGRGDRKWETKTDSG